MRQLNISTANSRYEADVKARTISWPQWLEICSKPRQTSETIAEYLAMDPQQQLATKDVGYFVGGEFNGTKRRREKLKARSMITLDIDHAPAGFVDEFELCYGEYEYLLHSSHKHQDAKPRLRLIFPLSRDVTPEEYEPVCRRIASWLNIDWYDITTFEPARVMFLPSKATDGVWFYQVNKGRWLDPDAVLAEYDDWKDMKQWAFSTKEGEDRHRSLKAADPLNKPGIIGAFNRAFTVSEVLHSHIPGIYLPTRQENRWTFHKATSKEGAIIYDNDTLLYSNHETDPCYRHSTNAFDLVRIHRFGELDVGAQSAPVTKKPSFLAATQYALTLSAVVEQLDAGTPDREEQMSTAFGPGVSLPSEAPAASAPAVSLDDGLGEVDDGLGLYTPEAKPIPSLDDDVVMPLSIVSPQVKEAVKKLKLEIVSYEEGEESGNLMVETIIPKIAGLSCDAITESTVIDLLCDHYKTITKNTLRLRPVHKRIAEIRQALSVRAMADFEEHELEDMCARYVLRHSFNSGNHLIHMAKCWWLYSKGFWRRAEDKVILQTVANALLALKEQDDKADKALYAALAASGRANYFNTFVSAICDVIAQKQARDSADDPLGLTRVNVPSVMNTEGAELWFEEGTGRLTVKPQTWDSLQTTKLNVRYQPDAKCPRWDQIAKQLFSEYLECDEMIRHLYELGGYILQPTRETAVWSIFHGAGDNGKTLIWSLLTAIMDVNSSLSVAIAKIEDQNDKHFSDQLFGKLLLLDDDWKTGALLPDDVLKKVSERKRVTANPKFGAPYTFISRTVPVILANTWPYTLDITHGLIRRLQVFDMTYQIKAEEKDMRLLDYLIANELPGILNHFVRGWQRLAARGGAFDTPFEAQEARNKWLGEANVVGNFVKNMMIRTPGDRSVKTSCSVVYNTYLGWASRWEHTKNQMPRQKFYAALTALGLTTETYNNSLYYFGVDLKPLPDFED